MNYRKFILGLAITFFSTEIFSLSCAPIEDLFFLKCDNVSCQPLFKVSHKEGATPCGMRLVVTPIELELNEFISKGVLAKASEPGVYSVNLSQRKWMYKEIVNSQHFKKVLDDEYRVYLMADGVISKDDPAMLSDYLEGKIQGVYLDYYGLLSDGEITNLRQGFEQKQAAMLAFYIFIKTIDWGGVLLLFILTVYFTNAFFRDLYKQSKVRVRIVLGQILIFLILVVSLLLVTLTFWVGIILLPAVVVILIAELFAYILHRRGA